MTLQAPLLLQTGALARYPLGRKFQFATRTVKFADFSRQTFAQLAKPLGQWVLNLQLLQDQEANDWLDFWKGQQGAATPFVFLDPADNLLQYSEAQEQSPWFSDANTFIGMNYALQSQAVNVAPWATSSTGGVAVPTITPNISSPLAPDGTQTADQIAFPATSGSQTSSIGQTGIAPPIVASQTFAFSIFLQASGATTINLVIQDQAGNVIATNTVNLTTSWQRLSVSGTAAGGATSLKIFITQPVSQSAKTVYGWGAQVEYNGTASIADYTATTTAAVPLLIPDPFWVAAPAGVPGASFNLNSNMAKRGRRVVITNTGTGFFAQKPSFIFGGAGNSRTKGLTLSGSMWFQQVPGGSPSLTLYCPTDNVAEGASVILTPTSSWVRQSATHTFQPSNPNGATQFGAATFEIANFSATGMVNIFGAQLEVEGAVSQYKKTDAYCGLHAKCFFQTDEFDHQQSEFNVSTAQLVIEESN